MNNTINTWLPCFNGFYSSIYEPNEEMELEHINELRAENNLDPIEFDDLEFDYQKYRLELSEEITNAVEHELKSLELVHSVEYQKLVSPKEYNFANDSINVGIVPNSFKIRAYWTKYRDEWEQHLKDTYTSYDGFISSYDNNNWSIETILNGEHELGAFLNFALMNEDITEYEIYDNVENAGFIQCSNYDKALSMATKPQIPKILTGGLVVGCLEQITALRDYEKRLNTWNKKGE